jgi:hypothetical protein
VHRRNNLELLFEKSSKNCIDLLKRLLCWSPKVQNILPLSAASTCKKPCITPTSTKLPRPASPMNSEFCLNSNISARNQPRLFSNGVPRRYRDTNYILLLYMDYSEIADKLLEHPQFVLLLRETVGGMVEETQIERRQANDTPEVNSLLQELYEMIRQAVEMTLQANTHSFTQSLMEAVTRMKLELERQMASFQ